MRKESCITHPAREPLLVIRKWQVEACDDNVCAAALLSFFEYWHNIRLDQREKAKQANKVAKQHNEVGTQDESLYQFHNEQELQSGIMHLYSIRSIREALPILESKKFISIHKNPNPRYAFDKTRYFIFNPDVVNDVVRRLRPNLLCPEEELPQPIGKIADGQPEASPSGDSASSSGKKTLPSGKNAPPITETTTETTPKTTTTTFNPSDPLDPPISFENVWLIYHPARRKVSNKKTTEARCRAIVTSGDATWEQLVKSAERYTKACEILGREPRFVQHAEVFFGESKGQWRNAMRETFVDEYVEANKERRSSFNAGSTRPTQGGQGSSRYLGDDPGRQRVFQDIEDNVADLRRKAQAKREVPGGIPGLPGPAQG